MKIRRIIAFLTAFTAVFSTDTISSVKLLAKAEDKEIQELYGDLDGSMILDSMDLVLMKKAVAKKSEYNVKADLDNDNDVDLDDVQLLSDYILRNIRCFPVCVQFDSDNDGINDFAEIELYNTDCHNADTDNDGISDQDELNHTKTDPVIYDSEKKGISDAEADIDEDGLSNLNELQIGSDPRNADSDGDGLDDGYEVNKSKTSPVNIDTDGDGITDFEEIELGLDPLNTETDGISDKEHIFTQIILSDDPLFTNINTDDNAYDISVEIKASGYAKKLLNVRESGYSYAMKNGSALGIIPEFKYNDDFKVKEITINFKLKEPFVDNVSHYFENSNGEYEVASELEGIKRLTVFKYFDSINLAMPIYTEYDVDNNIVKVTIDAFETDDDGNYYDIGSYALVDLEVWGDIMNNRPETEEETVVDVQNSNEDNSDKSEIVKKTVPELNDSIVDLLCKNYETIIPSTEKQSGITSVFGHKYRLYDTSEMDYPGITSMGAIDACRNKGGHLMTITSQFEYKLLKDIIAAGKSGYYRLGGTGNRDHWDWLTGESADYLYTIQSDNYDPESHGQYFDVFNNNLVYCAGHDYKLADRMAVLQASGYICEWEPGEAITDTDINTNTGSVPFSFGIGAQGLLKAILNPDSGIDTDGDGTPDWDELDHEALKKLGAKSGETSVSWMSAFDYTKKRKLNSRQPNVWDDKIKKILKKSGSITPTKTNLVEADSDHDGIVDSKDARPNEPFSSLFELTDTFETIQTNDVIDDLAEKSNDVWKTADVLDYYRAFRSGIYLRACLMPKGGRLLGLDHPADFLEHFLENNGEDYYYDCSEVIEKTHSGKKFFDVHMNLVRILCETTVVDELKFKTVPSAMLTATDFSQNANSDEEDQTAGINWWFSIGDSMAAMSIDCIRDDNKYTAKIRYYILDFYDWEKDSTNGPVIVKDGEMYDLHKMGAAKDYRSIGLYETEMTWTRGEFLDIDHSLSKYYFDLLFYY